MGVVPFSRGGGTRAQALVAADGARLRRYREYLAFYEGQHYTSPRRGRSNLVINYARTIVDKGVSFLLGRGIGFAVEPAPAVFGGRAPRPANEAAGSRDPQAAIVAEALLYQVYDDNDLDQVDLACATNAAVLGDGVYKVFWDAATRRIRVVSVDPFGFFATWRPDDLATLQQVDLVYSLPAAAATPRAGAPPADGAVPDGSGARRRFPLLAWLGGGGRTAERAAPADPAATVTVVETWTERGFRLAVDGRVVRDGPNPYGVIPFVHVPNLPAPNEFWGRSDLVDVIPLNRELNERMSDQADVIRYHADPPVVFRGVEDHDAITVGPGSVWDLPKDADVKLLEWHGQPVAVQDHINQVLRALYETSETPRTAFGDSGRVLSGVALETELRPLIQKTLRKRVLWTAALRRRARLVWRVAEAVGLAPPGAFAGLRPRIVWPSMMPQDDTQDVRNNVALVAAGLRSRRTALDALGTESPEAELARIAAERAGAAP